MSRRLEQRVAGLTVWQRIGRWRPLLPVVLLCAAVVIDFVTPPTVSAAALYAAAILTAAPLLSLRGTVVTGVAAFLLDLAMFGYFGFHRTATEYSELAMVATVAVISGFLNRLLHHLHTQLQSARDIAATVQRAVLRDPPRASGPLRFGARYEAAQSDAQIGGDLYAVVDTPFGVRCVIGDVRGKGLNAVRAVADSIGTFREAALQEPSLVALVERLERAVALELEQSGGVTGLEGFITSVVAEFPRHGNKVRLINRGHPAPLLLLPDAVRYVEPSRPALPLGLTALAAGPEHVDTLTFPEGATLLLYTDGLSEARDAKGAFYEPVRRPDLLRHARPDALLDALLADVHRHTGGHAADDMALLAITHVSEGA
ncbi:PP2C family protein-serine/threonine phosphatase [Streptomyces sp. NPDC059618]|uniref:PP2C family protein-serine/threonine phosphatase n=1 Tax=Streptomyces sp. NPDC059618 TaxID=3346887 RepID=UPI0036782ADF